VLADVSCSGQTHRNQTVLREEARTYISLYVLGLETDKRLFS
jgi:hypothetical protein